MLDRIEARGHGHREVYFEPGRSLVGNAGVLLTRVEFLKPGAEKNFAIVDAAMNDLARPAMYEAYHRYRAGREARRPGARVRRGRPGLRKRRLARSERVLAVEPGDLLVIRLGGRLWLRHELELQHASARSRSDGRW